MSFFSLRKTTIGRKCIKIYPAFLAIDIELTFFLIKNSGIILRAIPENTMSPHKSDKCALRFMTFFQPT